MKKATLMITLFVLMITLIATASIAVTGQELADSPLTSEQKNQVIAKVIKKDDAGAQALFDELMKEVAMAEAIAFQKQFQTEMKAEADAKLASDQAEYSKKLISKITRLKIEDVWAEAIAYTGSIGNKHEKFIAMTLASRYSIKGEFDTIKSVEIAYNQRSAELKIELAREAKTKAIVIDTLLPLATKMGEMEIRIDILEQDVENGKIDLVSMATDLASVVKAKEENLTNFNALVRYISDDEDDKKRLEAILQEEQEK